MLDEDTGRPDEMDGGAATAPPDIGSGIPQAAPQSRTVQIQLPDTPPTATKVLVVAIVAVYVLGIVVGHDFLRALAAKNNSAILYGGQYYRLLTVMFLHAGIAHLFMNSYALWIIGRDVERFYGHLRFVGVYVLAGLTASVASLAFTEANSVGASGAVFGIFAAEMVLLVRNRSFFGPGARHRLQSLVMLLLLNAAIGIAGASIIDNWAHIGGFIGGAAVSWLIGPVYRIVPPPLGVDVAQVEDVTPAARLWWVGAIWLAALAAIVVLLVATA